MTTHSSEVCFLKAWDTDDKRLTYTEIWITRNGLTYYFECEESSFFVVSLEMPIIVAWVCNPRFSLSQGKWRVWVFPVDSVWGVYKEDKHDSWFCWIRLPGGVRNSDSNNPQVNIRLLEAKGVVESDYLKGIQSPKSKELSDGNLQQRNL